MPFAFLRDCFFRRCGTEWRNMIRALRNPDTVTVVPSVLKIITKDKLRTRHEVNFAILILSFFVSIFLGANNISLHSLI